MNSKFNNDFVIKTSKVIDKQIMNDSVKFHNGINGIFELGVTNTVLTRLIHVRFLTTPPKKAICPIAISDWVSYLKQP